MITVEDIQEMLNEYPHLADECAIALENLHNGGPIPTLVRWAFEERDGVNWIIGITRVN
jgi:hypothetical protein